ncbi:MAG: ribose-phosphate pyrophosphokinase [Anaerolineae bacterium]|nr:ribose-phosphate pyrophosphokinase [Anaerolineae bacterium]
MESMYGKLALYTGTANPGLAQEVAQALKVDLSPADVFKFPNDNIFIRLQTSARSRDVFVIQPTCPPVNTNIMQLLIFIDTLKRDSAGRITAVMPYYGYGRTDKKDQPRVPITARLVADLITVAGADRVLMMDLHAGQIQGFFKIPVDDITTQHLLGQHMRQWDLSRASVVAADLGGAKRARNFAEVLGVPLALIEKRRSQSGASPSKARALNLIGEIEGRDAIIYDDEIDTAGTVTEAAAFLRSAGARSIRIVASHPILSDPATERLRNTPIEEIVVTNTVPVPERKLLPNMTILSVGPLLGEVIRRIHLGLSVGEMFNE